MDVQAAAPVRFATITAIPSGGRNQQLAVAQDQTLEGQVVSVEGDTVVVQIGQQRVSAQTSARLELGDLLRLHVREAGDDRVVMQVVGRGADGPTVRSLTDQDLGGELERVGVQPDAESTTIARELIGAGLPVTASNVLDVRSAFARLRAQGGPGSGAGTAAGAADSGGLTAADEADLHALVFLKAQGLPTSPEAARIVRSALASSSALGTQVQELRESLANLAARLTALSPGSGGAGGVGLGSAGAGQSAGASTGAAGGQLPGAGAGSLDANGQASAGGLSGGVGAGASTQLGGPASSRGGPWFDGSSGGTGSDGGAAGAGAQQGGAGSGAVPAGSVGSTSGPGSAPSGAGAGAGAGDATGSSAAAEGLADGGAAAAGAAAGAGGAGSLAGGVGSAAGGAGSSAGALDSVAGGAGSVAGGASAPGSSGGSLTGAAGSIAGDGTTGAGAVAGGAGIPGDGSGASAPGAGMAGAAGSHAGDALDGPGGQAGARGGTLGGAGSSGALGALAAGRAGDAGSGIGTAGTGGQSSGSDGTGTSGEGGRAAGAAGQAVGFGRGAGDAGMPGGVEGTASAAQGTAGAGGAGGRPSAGQAGAAQGAAGTGAGNAAGAQGAIGADQAGTAAAGQSATRGTNAEAPSLGRLLEAVSTAISRLPVIDDAAIAAGRAGLADQIHRVVADQATPVEAKLARVLDGIASQADLPRELSADLRTVVTGLVQEVDRHLAAASGAGLTRAALGDLEAVRDRAQSLLGRVELNQLTNAAHAATPSEGQMIFQIPLPGGRGDQTAEIRIRPERDGSSRKIDPNNVSVVFQFQLQGLQTVRIGVRVQDRHLTCSVGSTDAGATELLRQHAPELRQGLSGLGYLVDEVRCSVLTPADLALPDEPAPTVAAPRQVLRLDARA